MQGKKPKNKHCQYMHKYVSGKKYRDSYGKRQLQNFILSGRMKVIEMCQPFSGQQERAAEITAVVIPAVFLSDQ